MKKIIISIACTAMCLGAYAQQKVAEYRSDYFDKNFYVELGSLDEYGDINYYVAVNTDDLNIEDVNIKMNQSTVKEFISALETAKAKYSEWVTVAENKGVSYVEKKMNVDFPSVKAGFEAGEWDFTDNEIKPIFKVDGGKYMLILKGDPISNDYYNLDGGYNIVFSSIDEIDGFIKCFDETIINSRLERESKLQKLASTITEETTTNEYSDFTSYHSDYFGQDFDVKLSAKKDGEFTYCIETASNDRYMDSVTIRIKSSELKNMRDAMTKTADYYKRWSEVAGKNGITDLDKTIDVQFPKYTGRFLYGSWYNDNNETTITPRFRVMDGKCMLILTGSRIATEYVDCDGFYIVLESQAELDSFIKCFDPQLAETHFGKKSSTDTLFN